ncbi:MAG: hypothetical protein ACPLRU_05040, partial [Desulfofundulus sp.]
CPVFALGAVADVPVAGTVDTVVPVGCTASLKSAGLGYYHVYHYEFTVPEGEKGVFKVQGSVQYPGYGVSVWLDGEKLASLTANPWTVAWASPVLGAGRHVVEVQTYDFYAFYPSVNLLYLVVA